MKINKKHVPKLSELSEHELRGWIVNEFLQIESNINEIITKYFEPKHKDDFRQYVLTGTAMDNGSKAKLLHKIGLSSKLIDKFRKLSSIRNGFAHARLQDLTTIIVNKSGDEVISMNVGTTTTLIYVMNSRGDVHSYPAFELASEFVKIYYSLKEELIHFSRDMQVE